MRALPVPARAFVTAVIAAAAFVLAYQLPVRIPDGRIFALLALSCVVTSGLKLRLPLGHNSANLSVSYTVDFAALLLLGVGPTMLLSMLSACVQSMTRTPRRNPLYRVLFNVATVILTVQAAGLAFGAFDGHPMAADAADIAVPLAAASLAYYLCSTGLVAAAVALSGRQGLWVTWHSSFLWTAPGYFVGAIAAAAGAMLFLGGHGWLVPLGAAPVLLTFLSYRVYLQRITAEQRHKEEVQRLHAEAVEALRAARESEERYALAANGSNDGLWDWNLVTGTFYCSDRWKLMIGLPLETPVERFDDWCRYVHDDDVATFKSALARHLVGDSPHFQCEYRMRTGEGDVRWILSRGVAVRDEAGEPVRMSGSQTDVTDRRRIEIELAHAASHDALTGLPNRTMLRDLLDQALARTRRAGDRFAVLFIDLDQFKYVNDSLGHAVGDKLLVEVSERLKAHLRPGDVLARLGGDEFAVLVYGVTETDIAVKVVHRLQQSLRTPIRVDGSEIYASASIGIAYSSEAYITASDLLRAADTAMYRAKGAGRGHHREFEPQMYTSAMGRLTLETELRAAIGRGDLVVQYQPIVDLETDEISGFEALVRWKRLDGTIVEPSEFIPVAEDTGLIAAVTEFVLRVSCYQAAEWQRAFRRPLTMTVNVSTHMFNRESFVDDVRRVTEDSGIAAGTLRLEITESVLMGNADATAMQLAALREMDVQLYLDDFGTGYSSLSYLQRYHLDALKIDRSFVDQIGHASGGSAILGVIINLARELGMGVIAEGVETRQQAERLIELQCSHAQGFLFSRPLDPAAAYDLLLRAWSTDCFLDARLDSAGQMLPVLSA